jgi:hypothetical protein
MEPAGELRLQTIDVAPDANQLLAERAIAQRRDIIDQQRINGGVQPLQRIGTCARGSIHIRRLLHCNHTAQYSEQAFPVATQARSSCAGG